MAVLFCFNILLFILCYFISGCMLKGRLLKKGCDGQIESNVLTLADDDYSNGKILKKITMLFSVLTKF